MHSSCNNNQAHFRRFCFGFSPRAHAEQKNQKLQWKNGFVVTIVTESVFCFLRESFFRSCRLILTVLCIFESHQNWATHKTSKFLAALGRTFSLHFSTQQFLELWGLWPLLSLAFTVKINNFTRFYYGFRLFRTVWIMIFDIVFLGPLIIMLGDVFGVWVG